MYDEYDAFLLHMNKGNDTFSVMERRIYRKRRYVLVGMGDSAY